MKRDKRIVSITHTGKIVITWDRIGEVLTKEEKLQANKLLGKLIEYDETIKECKNEKQKSIP